MSLADPMPGVAGSDLVFVAAWTIGVAIAMAVVSAVLLKLMAGRSIRAMLTLVAFVTVGTSLGGVVVITVRMIGATPGQPVFELLFIAGLAGLGVAALIGRRLTMASGTLLGAVREVGESGSYTPPPVTLPAELAGLSDELATAHDRLGKSRARERALEASRRELVAWVSHDLRTPLAGLRAMAEALEDEVIIDPAEVRHYHSQLRIEAERLAKMIDDLFELSKIHAGALKLHPRKIGLEDLIAEVVASVEPVARAKGIRLAGSAVRGMPVHIDAAEMGRAVRNLVSNAIRHTPPSGTIEILGEIQAGMAAVSVTDQCGGIPPEDLPRVFDVAFRGESARTPDPTGGAGLGLSIARGIVEAHTGQIGVRNTGPGCQFIIKLPLLQPGAPVPAPPHSSRLSDAFPVPGSGAFRV